MTNRSNNRFGLLEYQQSFNLGDEIQSLAAKQYLPSVDCLIDRDTGKSSSSGSGIKVIYNGWFDGQYGRFPPPKEIDPLFISFHINESDHSKDKSYAYLEERRIPFTSISSHIDYFKQFEPIGCRDLHTMELLQAKGVKAYWSGCLTMTLTNRFQTRTEEILVVDAHLHARKIFETIIPAEIRSQAIYLNQAVSTLLSQPEKMTLAQAFLDRLAQAKLVITSRLHTTLPCLAFKTPVIFLHPDLQDVRFSGLSKFFKAYTWDDQLDIDLLTYQNTYPPEFGSMVTRLRQTARGWINQGRKGTSIFSACMNRNEHLARALPTWLAANPDEIVIVDWGSKLPLKPLIEKLDPEKKVVLITVPNALTWILSRSFNLAARMTLHSNILKVDADTLLSKDFFERHNLDHARVYFAGDWSKSRNDNEKHTNGVVYMKRADFFGIGGYNEYITTYGYDDCDLYKHLDQLARRLLINLDTLAHIEHDNSSRMKNARVGLDVEIEKNRLISELNLWNAEATYARFDVQQVSPNTYTAQFLQAVSMDPERENQLLERALKNRVWARRNAELAKAKNLSQKRKLFIRPKNGLGNRLRCLASAYNIAKGSHRELIIVWIPDFHCEAKFGDLFKLNYLFREASFLEQELDLSAFIARNKYYLGDSSGGGFVYNYDKEKGKYIDDSFEGDIYVSSACVLNNKHTDWVKENLFLRHLQVTDELAEKIYAFEGAHDVHDAIGLHIRMGQPANTSPPDDISNYGEEAKKALTTWRSKSHWTGFVTEMEKIIQEEPDQAFFLCCDNEFISEEIQAQGKFRLMMTPKTVYDRSVEQVQSAIVDLLLLSKTKYILGSNWSSFTEIAHRLGGKALKLAGIDF